MGVFSILPASTLSDVMSWYYNYRAAHISTKRYTIGVHHAMPFQGTESCARHHNAQTPTNTMDSRLGLQDLEGESLNMKAMTSDVIMSSPPSILKRGIVP